MCVCDAAASTCSAFAFGAFVSRSGIRRAPVLESTSARFLSPLSGHCCRELLVDFQRLAAH